MSGDARSAGRAFRTISHAAPHAAVELALLLIILAAFLRTAAVIRIGLDPHHDSFSKASALYAGDGLKAHLHFFTHYGVIDAALPSGLLRLACGALLSQQRSILTPRGRIPQDR